MTRAEVAEEIHRIVQGAVEKGGGDWRQSYAKHVERIFETMGKLAPEPKTKPTVPPYSERKVRRVGTLIQKHQFSEADRTAAVNALRAVGLL